MPTKKPARKTAKKPVKKAAKKAAPKGAKKAAGKKAAAPAGKPVKHPVKKAVKKAVKKPAPKKASAARKPVKRPAATVVKKVVRKPAQTKVAAAPAVRQLVKETAAPKGLSKDKQEVLRKNLISHRNTIIREAKDEIAKFIKGDSKQLVDTALDDGDWSLVDISEDLNLRKLSAHKETLNKIDEALRKINDGSYGFCEDCGVEISEARLRVVPFAIFCVDCKERRERMEEFEKEEEY